MVLLLENGDSYCQQYDETPRSHTIGWSVSHPSNVSAPSVSPMDPVRSL
jgi:hypothetical protein